MQTHGYERVKGPAGRVEVGSKLIDAASAWTYDWKDTCVVMAIQNGWNVKIDSIVQESAGIVVVDCQRCAHAHARAFNFLRHNLINTRARARSACQMESGIGGYSAVVVQGAIPEECELRFNYHF